MTDVLAERSFRGLAAAEAIEAVHDELDGLWNDAPFVQDMDQMTFTTAVIESASNIVQHALPTKAQRPVELGVAISVQPTLLQARVSAFYAKPPVRSAGARDPGPRIRVRPRVGTHRGAGDHRDLRTAGRHQHLDPVQVPAGIELPGRHRGAAS
jgi:serine/threonine-protein kinase RsbW